MTRHAPFWMLAATVFLAPTLIRWLTEGMFMDGLLYAVISRNLAEGVGSAWAPMLTPTLTPEMFTEHPPAVFWIQSLFYRAFGDHFVTEGIYSFATAAATAAVMVALWRRLARDAGSEVQKLAWLPVLFWAMTPQVSWAYSNNMLEDTLSVVTTATCLVLLAAFASGRRTGGVVLAAALVCVGLLCKGVVALFPVAAIGIYWLVYRDIRLRAAVGYTALLLVLAAAGIGALVLFHDGARANLAAYVDQQLVASVAGHRGSVSNRFNILLKIVSEVGPALGVCVVLLAVGAWRRIAAVREAATFRAALACLLLGVAGSVPIAVSPRQSAFYLVPSFPMYALGLGLLVAPVVRELVRRIDPRALGFRVFASASALLLVGVIGYAASQFGTVRRNQGTIHDVKTIATVVPHGATVTVCESMMREWSLHGYFARYVRITLDGGGEPRPFAVIRGEGCNSVDLGAFERVPLDTRELALYRRR